MKKLMLIIDLVLLLQTGCSSSLQSPSAASKPTETPAPPLAESIEDILGYWQIGSGDVAVFFQFDESGDFRSAQRLVSNLQESPQQTGQFSLEGGILTISTSDESPYCAAQEGTYEVHLLEQGQISFSMIEDQCLIRNDYWMRSTLSPISP
jgi:hypothetical protein